MQSSNERPSEVFHGTTILAVRRKGVTAVAGDGQVTFQNTIMKRSARKVRRIHDDKIVVGFAGATADAMSLFEKLEEKLKEYNGSLARAAVELAKLWRTDKYLRHLEALLIAVSSDRMLLISGNGDVIDPDDDVAAIGSGGSCALAAARALVENTDLDAESIARKSLTIAAAIDVYTNDQIVVETIHGA
ncbi:MAG: ATP-dependent protease subunit HslV [Candidatus Sumerlaeota bacterium]|nr:ATP-dependent protease subunit HslV [Candidatus Sumerlaeota bacterium]